MGVAGAAAAATAALAAGGDLDGSFGTGGVVQYAATGNWLADCAVQADGKVIVASLDGSGSSQRWRIDRRLATGALDTTYGSGGSATLLSGATPSDVTLDASGRAVASGKSTVSTTSKGKATSSVLATVARLSAGGSVEFTTTLAVPGASASVARAVAVDGSGRIVVAGEATITTGRGSSANTQSEIFVARLTSLGALDTSFGSSGFTVNDLTSGDDRVYAGALGLQSDGKIVLGGGHTIVVGNVAYQTWDVTRYGANGGIDASFGAVHGPSATDADLAGLAIDANDCIVAVGARYSAVNASDMLAVRFTANGLLDAGFGSGGAALVHDTLRSQAGNPSIDVSGRITFLGYDSPNAPTSGERSLVTVRLDATGALDSAYGAGGVTSPLVLGKTVDPRGLALTADDKVVVAGDAYDASNAHTWFVARYLGD
jgi:uncharacterized delta-60 repeat protein